MQSRTKPYISSPSKDQSSRSLAVEGPYPQCSTSVPICWGELSACHCLQDFHKRQCPGEHEFPVAYQEYLRTTLMFRIMQIVIFNIAPHCEKLTLLAPCNLVTACNLPQYLSGSTEITAGSLAAREACDLMGDRRSADIVLTDLESAAPLPDAVLVIPI